MLNEFSFRSERLGADQAALLLVGMIDADVVSKILDRLDQDHCAVPVLEWAFYSVRPRLGVDDDVVGRLSAVGEGRARHHRDLARLVHAHHVFDPARGRYEHLQNCQV